MGAAVLGHHSPAGSSPSTATLASTASASLRDSAAGSVPLGSSERGIGQQLGRPHDESPPHLQRVLRVGTRSSDRGNSRKPAADSRSSTR